MFHKQKFIFIAAKLASILYWRNTIILTLIFFRLPTHQQANHLLTRKELRQLIKFPESSFLQSLSSSTLYTGTLIG